MKKNKRSRKKERFAFNNNRGYLQLNFCTQ